MRNSGVRSRIIWDGDALPVERSSTKSFWRIGSGKEANVDYFVLICCNILNSFIYHVSMETEGFR
jgi:hypothetical protein